MEDNKFDTVDSGDLVYAEEINKWVEKEEMEAEEKRREYEEELDVHHDVKKSNFNLAD